MNEKEQLLSALEYPPEQEGQVKAIVNLLYVAYVNQYNSRTADILINILKKKGVRLTENFETPLDAGPPV